MPSEHSAEIESLRREVERLTVLATKERGLLEAVLHHSPHGIIVSDAHGKLILQNRAAERIWAGSATAENVEGWGQYRAFHPDGRPYAPDDWSMARALRDKAVTTEENHIQRFDGRHAFLLGSSAPILDADGNVTGGLSVFADITDLKKAEQELRRQQSLLSTTLRSIGDAVIATDAIGIVSFLNPVAEALTGWAEADAMGVPIDDVFRIVNESTRATVESPVARVIREGRIVELANHTVLIRKDGTELPIDDSGSPIHDEKGTLAGVVLVFRDVTARRRDEQRAQFLKEATALLTSSLDFEATIATVARLAVPRIADWCAVDLVEADGELRRLAVTHVDPDKVALAHDLQRRYPPDRSAPRGVHHVIRTGTPEIVLDVPPALLEASARSPEHLALIKALQIRSYLIVPLRARGQTLGALTLVASDSAIRFTESDVALATELAGVAAIAIDNARLYRKAEDALVDARKAIRAREDLLAVVSHDLRNPLNVVMMKSQGMLNGMGAEESGIALRKDVEILRRAGARMEQLVGDLLDLGSMEAGTFSVRADRQQVEPLVMAAAEQFQPLVAAKALRLRTTITAADEVVTCDRSRVLQVLSNLLANAIKFTPEGGEIHLDAAPLEREVQFSVTDTGRGITPDHVARLFDRYWQDPRTSKQGNREGVGLGLFIAKGIVDAHRGRLWVESSLGRGSTFHFTLPRVR